MTNCNTHPQVDLLQQAIDMLDGTYQAHAVRKLLQDYQILSETDTINWYVKGWDDGVKDCINNPKDYDKDEILRMCLTTFMELSKRSSRHDDGLGYYDEECAAIRAVLQEESIND